MSAEENAANVNDIESLLSNLAPMRLQLERDRLMFLAGKDAAFRSPRRLLRFAWPAGFTGMSLIALSLCVWGVVQRKQIEVANWRLSMAQMTPAVLTTPPTNAFPPGYLGAVMGPPGLLIEDQPLEPWEAEGVAAAERAEALRLAATPSPSKQRARRTDGRGPANTGYFQLRDQILAFGVEGVPSSAPRGGRTAATSSAYVDLLKGSVGNW